MDARAGIKGERMKLNLEVGSQNEQIIKDYLENKASEILVEKINNGKKTLKGCWNYIYSEARKRAENNCACIADTEVFGWAIHYFEEDSINESEISYVPVKTVVTKKKEEKSKSNIVIGQMNLFDFNGEEDEDNK